MIRTIHMSQSVTGPLANWSKRQWNQATKWMTRKDGSRFGSGQELKQSFIDILGDGWLVMPIGECDNFDKREGCLGHEKD